MTDYTNLCARLEVSEPCCQEHFTANEAAAAIRELEARAERAEEAHIFADAARDAAEAKLAEVERERDYTDGTNEVLRGENQRLEATVATLTEKVEAMRGALERIGDGRFGTTSHARDIALAALAALAALHAGQARILALIGEKP